MTVCAKAILDDDGSVKSVTAAYGATSNICHEAVKAIADPRCWPRNPTTSLCSASTTSAAGKRNGRPAPATGGRRWVDPWDTGLVDITGAGWLLVQVNGRAAQPVIDWLAPREQSKAGIKFVAIDVSATYAKAAREALPHA